MDSVNTAWMLNTKEDKNMKAHARLISLQHSLRTNYINLLIEISGQPEILRITPLHAFNDLKLMQQLNMTDRVRVAYWAGVEETKFQSAQHKLLKELLSKSLPQLDKTRK